MLLVSDRRGHREAAEFRPGRPDAVGRGAARGASELTIEVDVAAVGPGGGEDGRGAARRARSDAADHSRRQAGACPKAIRRGSQEVKLAGRRGRAGAVRPSRPGAGRASGAGAAGGRGRPGARRRAAISRCEVQEAWPVLVVAPQGVSTTLSDRSARPARASRNGPRLRSSAT